MPGSLHSKYNLMSLLLSLKRLDRLCQILASYGVQLRTARRVCIYYFASCHQILDANSDFERLTEDLAKLAETKEIIRDLESERING